jgi:hypothetical protein
MNMKKQLIYLVSIALVAIVGMQGCEGCNSNTATNSSKVDTTKTKRNNFTEKENSILNEFLANQNDFFKKYEKQPLIIRQALDLFFAQQIQLTSLTLIDPIKGQKHIENYLNKYCSYPIFNNTTKYVDVSIKKVRDFINNSKSTTDTFLNIVLCKPINKGTYTAVSASFIAHLDSSYLLYSVATANNNYLFADLAYNGSVKYDPIDEYLYKESIKNFNHSDYKYTMMSIPPIYKNTDSVLVNVKALMEYLNTLDYINAHVTKYEVIDKIRLVYAALDSNTKYQNAIDMPHQFCLIWIPVIKRLVNSEEELWNNTMADFNTLCPPECPKFK